jgi:hypothetical protein
LSPKVDKFILVHVLDFVALCGKVLDFIWREIIALETCFIGCFKGYFVGVISLG